MTLNDLELELRKLPGVRATGFDAADDILFVQLHVGPDRGDTGLAAQATRIAIRHSDRPVAVELVRWRPTPAPQIASDGNGASPTVDAGDPVVDLTTATDVIPGQPGGEASADPDTTPAALEPDPTPDATRIEGRRARLLAVLSFPDTDEIEVHLVVGGRRTIGRAPASGGVAAAVEATLDAVRQLGVPIAPRPRWARALERAEAGGDEPLVAVAIEGEEEHVHYGLAVGESAIEAAARSTLDALNRRLSLFL